MGSHRHLCKQCFQGQRGRHRRNDDQQNDRCEVDRIHHTGLEPLLRHDQSHFAAGHHADADLEGICPVEPADLRGQTAADDLGDECHDHEARAEQQDLGRQAADVRFQADTGKKHRRKQNVIADVHPAFHIRGIVHGAKDNARNVRTCDVCNAEVLLGDVGHRKAEGHTHNGDALGVGIALVEPLHGKVDHYAQTDGHEEEEHRVDQHLPQPGAGAGACAQHAGQHHDADHIVNDRCADDGGAKEALQVAKFLQRRHRDGNAGRRHDGADEQCFIKRCAADGRKAIERTVQQRAAQQRHRHAHAGDQGRNGTSFDELFQVGAKAGGEHQQHHADLCKDRDGVAGMDQIQQAGADQQTRDDLADHLRGFAFARHQAEKFRAEHDDRQIAEYRIHKSHPSLFLS